MKARTVAVCVAVAAAVLLLLVAAPSLLVSGQVGAGCGPEPTGEQSRWSDEQRRNAGIIVAVGQRKRVPSRGWVIAVAVAMQESSLRNLAGGDRDSVGLFQQRPSQGWGTREELMDPEYAAGKFYDKLLTVPSWQSLPLADAGQAVQRSADGSLYAKWEQPATRLVAELAGQPEHCAAGVVAGEWTLPVAGRLGSGFRTAARPGHDGIDLIGPRGAAVRAAAAGTVVTVVCNSSSGTCDRDGSPEVSGCGWFLELLHADRRAGPVVTRYCHLLRRPPVQVGQRVAAGQVIGAEGSSGNSSGPHLHFEVHRGEQAHESNAVEPVSFLSARGVHVPR